MEINTSLLIERVDIGNVSTSGPFGAAASTVDICAYVGINQTSPNMELTPPTPTNGRNGRICYVTNTGTVSFEMIGFVVSPGQTICTVWADSTWDYAGAPESTSNPIVQYASTSTYSIGRIVYSGSKLYRSLINGNTGQPVTSTTSWAEIGPELSGHFCGSAATYATLPTIDSDGSALDVGDWSALTVATIGTGTAALPQYPVGGYLWNGAEWSFSFPLGKEPAKYQVTVAGGVIPSGVDVYENTSRVVSIQLPVGNSLSTVTATPATDLVVLNRRDVATNTALVQVRVTNTNINLAFTSAPDSAVTPLTYDLGMIMAWPGSTLDNDAFIPASGGTFQKVDYPDLWAKIAGGLLAGFTSTATTLTVPNLNTGVAGGLGYFLGGTGTFAAGTLQGNTTAVNGLANNTAGAHTHSFGISNIYTLPAANATNVTYSGSDSSAQLGTVITASAGNHTHVLTGDAETRPHTYRITWVIRAKPLPTQLLSGSTLNLNTYTTPPTPLPNTISFLANGTYTPTAGMKYVEAQIVAGGGGGGGAAPGSVTAIVVSGSGGAGGYINARLTAAEVGASMAVVIGGAGTGGGITGTGGTAGGNTTLGGTALVANGGNGGTGGTQAGNFPVQAVAGAAGGGWSNTIGTIISALSGEAGHNSFGSLNAAGTGISTGAGGSTPQGTGGRGTALFFNNTGNNGANGNAASPLGFGGAGSGGSSSGTGATGRTGGAGRPGRVIITEYF